VSIGDLWFVPLVGPSAEMPAYGLYGPELSGGLEIREIGAEGRVSALRVRNRLAERVLLIDSDTLIGLKQNRTLNTDVLVPVGGELEIPVSCVEQGRWHARAAMGHASVYGGMSPYSVRAVKLASVSESVMRREGHRSSQAGVWEAVASCLTGSGTRSASAAMHDALSAKAAELESARAAMRKPEGAVGLAVVRAGDGCRLLGLDLFDRASTFEARWRSLVDGYLLEELSRLRAPAMTQPAAPAGSTAHETAAEHAAAAAALATIGAADWRTGPSPGEGADLRASADGLVMSALAWNEHALVHLQAFAHPDGKPDRRGELQATVRRTSLGAGGMTASPSAARAARAPTSGTATPRPARASCG
jgi:hypothetical protein